MTKKSKRPSAPPSRVAVVVLGMHRSGTSALAGVLGQLGCDLPQDLMPPTEDNPKGYFESNKVYRLNDALLDSAGTSWDDWQEFNPGWITSQRADAFRSRAQAVLDEEFAGSPLFVLKDPRICRFAPFWLDLLEQQGCRPLVVCTHRNPLDVAASLERREGWPLAYGLLLWLRHVLDAEAGSRGRPRFFTSYERLIGNWAGVVAEMEQALEMTLPRKSASVAAEVEAFLSRDLQHFRKDPDAAIANPLLSGWLRDSYDILETWAQKGERKADHARLDRIRAELNAAAPAFGGLIQAALSARGEVTGLRTTLEERETALQEAEAALGTARGENEDLRAARARLQKGLEEAQAMLEETREGRRNSDQRVEELTARISAKEKQIAETRAALDAARRQGEELRGSRQNQQETLQKLQAQLAALRQARQTADQKAAQAQAEVERLTDELAERDKALEEGRHERDKLRSSLEQRSHEAEQVGLELKAKADEAAQVARELTTARRKCERYQHDLERSERSLLLLKTQMAKQMQETLAESLNGSRSKPLEEARKGLEELRQRVEDVTRERDAAQGEREALEARLSGLEDALAAARDAGEEAARQAAAQAEEAGRLAAERTELGQSLEHEKEAAARMRDEYEQRIAELERANRDLLNSTSWRITGPLRRLVRTVRRDR
ncbi:sulfotransferase family protein [Acidimangrovimonas pyrenivorans]|uniref:Sulfotransferase family protein n=1 Tax=Acidimangrovimonas pyrenivorans TaxID=2030798 RepID=A0ABV7AM67_9RHOB